MYAKKAYEHLLLSEWVFDLAVRITILRQAT